MMELIITILGVSLIAGSGWCVLWIIGNWVFGIEREDKARDLESQIVTNQLARRDARLKIMWQIKDMPSCPEQTRLWAVYRQMEADDEELSKRERVEMCR